VEVNTIFLIPFFKKGITEIALVPAKFLLWRLVGMCGIVPGQLQ